MYKASFEKQHEGLRGENTSSDHKHKSIWVCPDFFFGTGETAGEAPTVRLVLKKRKESCTRD
jgi:hypothetical protein